MYDHEGKVFLNGHAYRLRLEQDTTTDKFVENRVKELTEPLVLGFINQANELSRQEHQRILQEVKAVNVQIPREHELLPVVAIRGTLCILRSMVYCPFRITGVKEYWRDIMGDDEAFFALIPEWNDLKGDAYIECVGKPKQFMSMMMTLWDNRVITSRMIFHSMSCVLQRNEIKWHDMCIGNATPDQYWGVPFVDFTMNVNSINLESLGKHEIYFNNTIVSIRQYIKDLPYKTFKVGRGDVWTT